MLPQQRSQRNFTALLFGSAFLGLAAGLATGKPVGVVVGVLVTLGIMLVGCAIQGEIALLDE